MDKTGDTNKRLEPRSNVFVIATLYTAGGSVPVRIRNMSANGALVETGQPPPDRVASAPVPRQPQRHRRDNVGR